MSSSASELVLSYSPDGAGLGLLAVAGFVGFDGRIVASSGGAQLSSTAATPAGDVVAWGAAAAVRLLVRTVAAVGSRKALLGGSDEALVGAVESNLSRFNVASRVAAGGDGAATLLADLNAALARSTFLCGNEPSAADLALYGLVLPLIAAPHHKSHPHLFRWARHVEAQPGVRRFLDGVKAPRVPAAPASSSTAVQLPPPPAIGVDELLRWLNGGAEALPGVQPLVTAKKEKKEKPAADAEAPKKAEPEVCKADLRVGRIVSATKHAGADRLFVLSIDVGEPGPRTVVAGLVGFAEVDDLPGPCAVLCNVPRADMVGVESNGRVLVATAAGAGAGGADLKRLVRPPAGARAGERIMFDGVVSPPEVELGKKVLQRVLKGFATGANGEAVWDGLPFVTSAGPCVAEGVSNGTVA